MANAARLKISLSDLDPAPWRIVDVPLSMNLTGLHRTIQAAFLWFDSHIWEFRIGEKAYGPLWIGMDDENVHNPDNKRLSYLEKFQEKEFSYTYDFGDGWDHRIEVQELVDAPSGSRLPKLVDGALRRPPEDVGGPPGFEYFLEAMADANHPEHAHFMNWYGRPFDHDDIEQGIVEIALKREAAMRPAVK